MRVLMILNNAPDYREPFLRELATSVDLTVVARPCEQDGLVAPQERDTYSYHEIPARHLAGTVWQPGLADIIARGSWDIVCSSINMRDVGRIRAFRRFGDLRRRWIWWGHIFGRTPLPGLGTLRASLLRRSAGALVFNEAIATDVQRRFGVPAFSFNNTQVRRDEFRAGVFRRQDNDDAIRLLFVGRNQPRKRLQRLIDLAGRREDIQVRLVGPGMETLIVSDSLEKAGTVQRFGRTVGTELTDHFDWADLVANPGHVGLLVMNTAQHGKAIVIDSSSTHAPEYLLAEEAHQPFVDFSDEAATDRFFDEVRTATDRSDRLRRWGDELQSVARDRYTIEHMAAVHVAMFTRVRDRLAVSNAPDAPAAPATPALDETGDKAKDANGTPTDGR